MICKSLFPVLFFGLLFAGLPLPTPAQIPCPDLIEAEWAVVQSAHCTDSAFGACLPVPYGDLTGFGIALDGQPLDQPVQACDFDSSYVISLAALPGGGQAGPYSLSWTINGMTFSGTFPDLQAMIDLLNQWDPAGEWKLDAGDLLITGGSSANAYGELTIQQLSSGIVHILSVQATLVPKGTRITLTQGVHMLVFEELATGCKDTLQVAVGCPQTLFLDTLLALNLSHQLCFEPGGLAGPADTLINFCPGESGEIVFLSIESDSCLVAEAVDQGSETACLLLCDAYGICDTIYLAIDVLDFDQLLPLAVPDTLTVVALEPALLDVLENDFLPGGADSVWIVLGPQTGQATLKPDGMLRYIPPEFDCLSPFQDVLTYGVCTPFGCDTARVLLRGACEGLKVFNGFSPNGDGVNDYFHIEGLLRYGPHQLWVFNRWGEVVFYSDHYQNDWDGTWRNRPLPSGTYFFLVEYGQGQRQSGYLQLER